MGNDRLALFEYFQHIYAHENKSQMVHLNDEARTLWLRYDFPGNVRELKNIVVRLTTKYPGYTIGRKELEPELDLSINENVLENDTGNLSIAKAKSLILQNRQFNLMDALKVSEQAYIDAALEISHGSISQAAKLLGINRTTLYSRMEALGRDDKAKN